MKKEPTRRDVIGHAARGAGLLAVGGIVARLAIKAHASDVWMIDPGRCINIRLGATGIDACQKCSVSCVLELSAVRAVNEFSLCGRCCICPAYYDVTSDTGDDGLPMRKLCPRDAIKRTHIGKYDPSDPLNSFYEYTIDETLCNGCGKCVMACKEPAGLGSIRLEVRHNLCLNCNRCSIAQACPDDAYLRGPEVPGGRASRPPSEGAQASLPPSNGRQA